MARLRALTGSMVFALAMGTLAVAPPGSASAADPGTLTARDGVLFEGCHAYPYSYAVQPTTTTWHLETFLTGPDGAKLGGGLFLSDSDAVAQDASFTICSKATDRGAFRIEARLTETEGNSQTTTALPGVAFTLGLPGSSSSLTVDETRPSRGDRVVFTLSSARQAPEGWVPNDLATVVLQRRTAAGWRRVGGGLTETNARGRTRIRLTWRGGRERYRMLTRGDADEYAGSRSSALTIRTG